MRKLRLLTAILMAVFCLQFCGEFAEAAQTINGKAIGSIDDIVKEVNGGDLSLPKKGLITLRGMADNDKTYLDVFASLFGEDGSASAKRKIWSNLLPDVSITKTKEIKQYQKMNENNHQTEYDRSIMRVPMYEGEPKFYRPAVSRRLYNGKRVLMFHNIAPNGSLKYFFMTLSSTRDENMVGATPDNLANTVRISAFGRYTSPAFSNAVTDVHSEAATENCISEVYGTGVMSVKGYDREIFVAASGLTRVDDCSRYEPSWVFSSIGGPYWEYRRWIYPKSDQDVRLEFFALNADDNGNMTYEALTGLTRTTPFRWNPYIVSIAVGDFDGDKYNNEVALMINSREEIRLFV